MQLHQFDIYLFAKMFQKHKYCHIITYPIFWNKYFRLKNCLNLVAPEILVPQQLLGLPFGDSVMAECLVEVGKKNLPKTWKLEPNKNQSFRIKRNIQSNLTSVWWRWQKIKPETVKFKLKLESKLKLKLKFKL